MEVISEAIKIAWLMTLKLNYNGACVIFKERIKISVFDEIEEENEKEGLDSASSKQRCFWEKLSQGVNLGMGNSGN